MLYTFHSTLLPVYLAKRTTTIPQDQRYFAPIQLEHPLFEKPIRQAPRRYCRTALAPSRIFAVKRKKKKITIYSCTEEIENNKIYDGFII